jgi:hypothetical protein
LLRDGGAYQAGDKFKPGPNGISSSSRLVASAFCKASVNLAERTRAALNSFAKPVLSVRNVRMAATLFYRSIDFSSLPQHRFLVAMMVRFSSASLRQ